MRTIGRHWHGPYRGSGLCGICGVRWPMSEMFKNTDGVWVCPDDADGMTRTDIAESERELSERLAQSPHYGEMAAFDKGDR